MSADKDIYDVIVVGGGAAGMIAAGRAGESGARAVLLEKMPRLGTKLRITGKGRCNLTNTADWNRFVEHFGGEGRFLNNAFGRFFSQDLQNLLSRLGVPTVTERGGRVFPASGRAGDVVAGFERYLAAGHVEIRLNEPAFGLAISGNTIGGVSLRQGLLRGQSVILAAGGASYPGTGSTGDAYPWLASAGHTVHPPRPALVPLETAEDWPRQLAGLSLRNVAVTLLLNGQIRERQFGEMLFTHFGISGPMVLSMSSRAVDALAHGKVELSIDLKPALTDEQMDARLRRDLDRQGRATMRTITRGLMPRRLVEPYLTLAGVNAELPAHQVTSGDRRALVERLRNLSVTITQPRPFREAMVTAGGVDLKEIEPRTMESRLVGGLFVVGELLNLHADTGGFNLQAAFSSGYVAGEAAGERSQRLKAKG